MFYKSTYTVYINMGRPSSEAESSNPSETSQKDEPYLTE